MHTLLGEEKFQQGMQLYFQRHDGQAVTCDDFVNAMMDASGTDLTQFKLWYEQFGTPTLTVETQHRQQTQRYTLTVTQQHAANDPVSAPLHIPFKLELLDPAGNSIALKTNGSEIEHALDITEMTQSFVFENVAEKPIPVLLEDFSAPVKLNYEYQFAELIHILKYARSDYARWEAVQQAYILAAKHAVAKGEAKLEQGVLDALLALVESRSGDLALLAELLALPTFDTLAAHFDVVPVDELNDIIAQFELQIATHLQSSLEQAYQALEQSGSLSAADIAVRAFKNKALFYLAKNRCQYGQCRH